MADRDRSENPNSGWGSPIGINPDGTLNIVGVDANLVDPDTVPDEEFMTEPEGLED
jgi:hypothetical protein